LGDSKFEDYLKEKLEGKQIEIQREYYNNDDTALYGAFPEPLRLDIPYHEENMPRERNVSKIFIDDRNDSNLSITHPEFLLK
jgi:hypothetical protein